MTQAVHFRPKAYEAQRWLTLATVAQGIVSGASKDWSALLRACDACADTMVFGRLSAGNPCVQLLGHARACAESQTPSLWHAAMRIAAGDVVLAYLDWEAGT